MRTNLIDVCKGIKRSDKKVQIPSGYLTELTNREQELIEGGDDAQTKHILINGEYVRVYVPKKLT